MKGLILEDIELWRKFKRGDNEALSLIYAINTPKLYRYGLKLTSNHSIVEDAIQDLFSDMVRNRKNLGDTDHIQFYLIKSFKRRLKRELRKEKRYSLDFEDKDYSFGITYSIEQSLILEEGSNQRINLLRNALNDLTPRQKEAIYLKYTQDLEYEQIAEIMEIGIEGSRNLIYRAVKTLKDSLKENKSLFILLLHKFI